MTWEIFFFKNHGESETGRLAPDFFLFFEKASSKANTSGQQLRFHIFW